MRDIIRDWTPSFINRRVDRSTLERLEAMRNVDSSVIESRLKDLDCEVDVMGAKLSFAVVLGLGLGALAWWDRRFAAAPFVGFAALVAPKALGFDPLLLGTRLLGFRSAKEIDREQQALKNLRGDFHRFQMDPTPKGALTAAQGEVGVEARKPGAVTSSIVTAHGLDQHPI